MVVRDTENFKGMVDSVLKTTAAVLLSGAIVASLYIWSDQRAMARDVSKNTEAREDNSHRIQANEKENEQRFSAIEKSIIRQQAILESIARQVGAPIPGSK